MTSTSSNNNNEKIIELSIMETQILRAKLGLAPLRISNSSTNDKGTDLPTAATIIRRRNDKVGANNSNNKEEEEEELSLSIDATNLLRIKIGLPPLKVDTHHRSSSSSIILHCWINYYTNIGG